MKKETKVTEEINEEKKAETKEAKASPLSDVMKSIASLSQVDRLVLYTRLDTVMNYDREKASHGVDACGHLFDEAINSL